jgi:hypothetical protein
MSGFALYLHLGRQSLSEWYGGEDPLKKEFTDIVDNIRNAYDDYLTRNALVENVNPRFAAFLASSDLNKREKVDHNHTLDINPHRTDPEEEDKLKRIFG